MKVYIIAGEHGFSVGDVYDDEYCYDILGDEDFMPALLTIQPGEFIRGVITQSTYKQVKQHYGVKS